MFFSFFNIKWAILKPQNSIFKRFFFLLLIGFSQASYSAEYTVWGAENFIRAKGSPVLEKRNFSVTSPSLPNKAFLRIYNGGKAGELTGRKISSSRISLNGVELANPSDFNQKMSFLEVPVTLLQQNELSIILDGKVGALLSLVIIGIDNELPTITPLVTPIANLQGWHNGVVEVSFKCDDQISGIVFCTEPQIVSTEGLAQQVIGIAKDKAGNESNVSVLINLDKTAPTLAYKTSPSSNELGWFNAPTVISYQCADNLSGVLECPANFSINSEGASQSVLRTISDQADNTKTLNKTFNLDFTAPQIALTIAPKANVVGWNNSDVSVTFSCTDTLSGILTCPPSQQVAQEGIQVISGSATDKAGHTSIGSSEIKLDKTAPTINATYSSEANLKGWFTQPVTVSFQCQDGLSGIEFCAESKILQTAQKNLMVNATSRDLAGNSSHYSKSINIDLAPPVITLLSAINNSIIEELSTSLLFSLSDDVEVDLSSLIIKVNNTLSNISSCTGGIAERSCLVNEGLQQGENILTVSIQDLAGNQTTVTTRIFTDLDKDSVSDNLDQCFETPLGETVNANGCSQSQLDDDNDGVNNSLDQCPATPEGEIANQQGCAPSQLDADTDGDGVLDSIDACPNTGEGMVVGDNGCDPSQQDTDGDGVVDLDDVFPEDKMEWSDLDGDGQGDNSDPDRDGDGVINEEDTFPNDSTESNDLDNDGIGDNADGDRDGDGILNDKDAFPSDPNRNKLPIVTIDSPKTLTTVGSSPILVSGTVDSSAVSVTLNGVNTPIKNNAYSGLISLEEGHNTIVSRMVDVDGIVSIASISISLDLTPPYLTVESHTDGQVVFEPSVTVTGLINDIVRGTIEQTQANVEVNGIKAEIKNRSYAVRDISLVEGENIIKIVGSDQVGNLSEHAFRLIYQIIDSGRVEIVSGQGQSGIIKQALTEPLIIQVLDVDDQPVVDKPVVFRVTQGSGILAPGDDLQGQGYLAKTDLEGKASVTYQLGQRAGVANHKIRVRVVGYKDDATFYASAEPNIGNKLSVNSGNNQRAGIHQPLPAPFVVAVTDSGSNVIAGSRVKYEVITGSGHFQNDTQEMIVVTDSDGRAPVHYTLGGIIGLDKQRVKATLLDSPLGQTITATFTASGFIAGAIENTSIVGTVLDNQDNPLPGVTVRIDGTSLSVTSNAQGLFKILNAPVGPVHLIADGATASVEGTFPSLSYNLMTVSGVENPLAAPIYMVKLNTDSMVYLADKDIELTLAKVPGFKLEVPAGSVTFPDGSKQGFLSVTVVNSSKVPMPPPNGAQPQFIVTIQPTGAVFDPPARLTLPNVDAHPAGAQVEMFSYDHDLEEFVAIGLGTVSKDALTIASNPGVGVIKAGWHCGAQPGGDGCCQGGGDCQDHCTDLVTSSECDSNCKIVVDRPLKGGDQIKGNCKLETCGGGANDVKPYDDAPEDEDPHDCQVYVCAPIEGFAAAPNETLPSDRQTPKDCKEIQCSGDIVNADDPFDDENLFDCQEPTCTNGEHTVGFAGSQIPAPSHDSNLNDCKTNGCDPDNIGEIIEVEAPDQKPIVGFCKEPICNGKEESWIFDPTNVPQVLAGHCPQQCKLFESGSIRSTFLSFSSQALDLEDENPGDCKMPGCDIDGNITDIINDFDRPDPESCKTCRVGEIVQFDGAIPGPGCFFCEDGALKGAELGEQIDSCNICTDAGTTPNPVTNGLPINDNNQCMICLNGNEVPIVNENLGIIIPTENQCLFCINGREEIRDCDDHDDQLGIIVVRNLTTGREVLPDEKVFINENGVMPNLVAEVDFPSSAVIPESIDWSFDSRHPRRPPHGCSVLNSNRDSRRFETRLSDRADWRISRDFQLDLPQNTFGSYDNANQTASMASFNATQSREFKLQILGENPEKITVQEYINSNAAPLSSNIMWAIALHESASENCDLIQQFNEEGSGCEVSVGSPMANSPTFGGPDGWGIMQVDGSNNSCDISTDVIWNWKKNVLKGFSRMNGKLLTAISSKASLRRAVQGNWDPNLATRTTNNLMQVWSEPPRNFDVTHRNGNSIHLTNMEPNLICAIQGYNGGGGTQAQYGPNGLGNWEIARYCFIFDINTGDWIYNPNTNSYVYEVLSLYQRLFGNLPTGL